LLHKQTKLCDLEAKLAAVDAEETRQLYLSSWRLDANTQRKELLQEIDEKLSEYGMWYILVSNVLYRYYHVRALTVACRRCSVDELPRCVELAFSRSEES
jgi:hypothetical protein